MSEPVAVRNPETVYLGGGLALAILAITALFYQATHFHRPGAVDKCGRIGGPLVGVGLMLSPDQATLVGAAPVRLISLPRATVAALLRHGSALADAALHNFWVPAANARRTTKLFALESMTWP